MCMYIHCHSKRLVRTHHAESLFKSFTHTCTHIRIGEICRFGRWKIFCIVFTSLSRSTFVNSLCAILIRRLVLCQVNIKSTHSSYTTTKMRWCHSLSLSLSSLLWCVPQKEFIKLYFAIDYPFVYGVPMMMNSHLTHTHNKYSFELHATITERKKTDLILLQLTIDLHMNTSRGSFSRPIQFRFFFLCQIHFMSRYGIRNTHIMSFQFKKFHWYSNAINENQLIDDTRRYRHTTRQCPMFKWIFMWKIVNSLHAVYSCDTHSNEHFMLYFFLWFFWIA